MENISHKIITARKPHRCDLCGCEIAKGTLYHQQFNKDHDNVWTFRTHCECQELTRRIEFVDNDGITRELFYETLEMYIHKKHYDEKLDDISEEWQWLSDYEAAKKILQELNEAEINYLRLNEYWQENI